MTHADEYVVDSSAHGTTIHRADCDEPKTGRPGVMDNARGKSVAEVRAFAARITKLELCETCLPTTALPDGQPSQP